MKTILTLILLLTINLAFAQEYFFVNAVNGLSCRVKPDVDAIKIGKLPYGSVVELVAKTQAKLSVTDNGEIKEGNWVEIKYTNFPYIVSLKDNLGYEEKAYVFDSYLEPLKKATINVEEIKEDTFNKYNANTVKNTSSLTKITDVKTIKKMLADKVTWTSNEDYKEYLILDSLFLDNGQQLAINQESNDYSVTAYYPEEEILVFEGGHASEFSISLKTGEALTTVGNPEYMITSPNGKIRLNGHFPGQECSSYFFQEIKDGKPIYLTDFGWGLNNGDKVCNFKTFQWISDSDFVYSYVDYSSNAENGVLKYEKGTITKTNSN